MEWEWNIYHHAAASLPSTDKKLALLCTSPSKAKHK